MKATQRRSAHILQTHSGELGLDCLPCADGRMRRAVSARRRFGSVARVRRNARHSPQLERRHAVAAASGACVRAHGPALCLDGAQLLCRIVAECAVCLGELLPALRHRRVQCSRVARLGLQPTAHPRQYVGTRSKSALLCRTDWAAQLNRESYWTQSMYVYVQIYSWEHSL